MPKTQWKKGKLPKGVYNNTPEQYKKLVDKGARKITHGSRLAATFPMEALYRRFSGHWRMQCYINRGLRCLECGVEGTRLVMSVDKGGSSHVDIYTRDWVLMTVDHILPKSRGGKDHVYNLRPLCCKCNSNRGSRMSQEDMEDILICQLCDLQ